MVCVMCYRLSCGLCYVLKIPWDCVMCCRFLWSFCVVGFCGGCYVLQVPVDCIMCCRFLLNVLCVLACCG